MRPICAPGSPGHSVLPISNFFPVLAKDFHQAHVQGCCVHHTLFHTHSSTFNSCPVNFICHKHPKHRSWLFWCDTKFFREWQVYQNYVLIPVMTQMEAKPWASHSAVAAGFWLQFYDSATPDLNPPHSTISVSDIGFCPCFLISSSIARLPTSGRDQHLVLQKRPSDHQPWDFQKTRHWLWLLNWKHFSLSSNSQGWGCCEMLSSFH